MLKFNEVSFSYGDKIILSDFNLSINDGEKVAILGHSGSGKTTILKLACGIEKPQSGDVTPFGGKASFVFQEDRLLPWCSAKENLAFIGTDAGRAQKLLDEIGIGEYSEALPDELSGGMKRRLAIARALSVDADVFFFDEPLHGLDIKSSESVLKLIRETTENKSVIVITHSPKEAMALAERVIVIGNRPLEILTDRKTSDFKDENELNGFIAGLI